MTMSMAFFQTDQGKANSRARQASIQRRRAIAPALSTMTADERQRLIDEAIAAGRVTKCEVGARVPTFLPQMSLLSVVR